MDVGFGAHDASVIILLYVILIYSLLHVMCSRTIVIE